MTAAEKLAELVAKLAGDTVMDDVNALLEEVHAEAVAEARTHLGARLAATDASELRACGGPGSANDDTMLGVLAGVRFAGRCVADPGYDY